MRQWSDHRRAGQAGFLEQHSLHYRNVWLKAGIPGEPESDARAQDPSVSQWDTDVLVEISIMELLQLEY